MCPFHHHKRRRMLLRPTTFLAHAVFFKSLMLSELSLLNWYLVRPILSILSIRAVHTEPCGRRLFATSLEAADGNWAAPYCFQSRGFPISREHSTGGFNSKPRPPECQKADPRLSGVIPFKHTATKGPMSVRGAH